MQFKDEVFVSILPQSNGQEGDVNPHGPDV